MMSDQEREGALQIEPKRIKTTKEQKGMEWSYNLDDNKKQLDKKIKEGVQKVERTKTKKKKEKKKKRSRIGRSREHE